MERAKAVTNVYRIDKFTARRGLRLSQRIRGESDYAERVRLATILRNQLTDSVASNAEDTSCTIEDGGPGSGNWGHEGRPGERGGSKGGGGTHNRQTTETGGYTSFSKQKKAAAKPHKVSTDELDAAPIGSVLHLKDGSKLVKMEDPGSPYMPTYYMDNDTGEVMDPQLVEGYYDTNDARISIPDSANPNYNVAKVVSREQYEKRAKAAFNAEHSEEYDDVYRDQSGEIWSSLDESSKKALSSYTGGGFHNINTRLRDGNADYNQTNSEIDAITSAIDRSELQEDTILHRDCSTYGFESLMHIEKGTLASHKDDVETGLVGKSGTDDGFMSTSGSSEANFGGIVELEILAPAGTKALYVEPISQYGMGDGINWDSSAAFDGKSKQDYFSNEFETILQRSTTLQVVSGSYNKTSHKYSFQMVVTGQNYKKSQYSKARA